MSGYIITTPQTAAYADADGRFALNVRWAGVSGDEQHYVWQVWADGVLVMGGGGIKGHNAGAMEALGALATFAAVDGEQYRFAVSGAPLDLPYKLGEPVGRWAADFADDLWAAAHEVVDHTEATGGAS